MNTLTTEGLRPEAKWHSIAFYFEWTFEIDRIRDDRIMRVDVDSLVQDARLKCNFDKVSILQWKDITAQQRFFT